jgi:hypothetical protein
MMFTLFTNSAIVSVTFNDYISDLHLVCLIIDRQVICASL